jgi:nicotinamide mononucleotide (NMN) deamidase PncC
MSNLFHDDHYTVGELTKKLASKLTDAGLRLTTAESCTGGKLSVALVREENTADFMMSGWWCSAMKQKRGSSACVLKRWRAIPPSANRR